MIIADGPAILWEFKGCLHLNDGLQGIDEIRSSTAWMYRATGDKAGIHTNLWADEIADLVKQHGGSNCRIAIDKLDANGVFALQEHGLTYVEGSELTEIARSIKSADEIELMRWTIRVCEAGMVRIYDHSVAGVTERDFPWEEI